MEQPPAEISIEFTEPPTSDASVTVTDGCERDVTGAVDISGTSMVIAVAGGLPGNWTVETRVISGLDGHETSDGFGFTVAGEADCSAEPTNEPTEAPDASDAPDDEGSFPFLPVALGTAGLVILAVALRALSSRE